MIYYPQSVEVFQPASRNGKWSHTMGVFVRMCARLFVLAITFDPLR